MNTVILRQYIQVPYIQYTISVKGGQKRKLTIMEWTLLRIISRYSSGRYQDKPLEFFFETVLGMNKSEPLVRPCVDILVQKEAITLENSSPYAMVSKMPLKQFHLTEIGQDALQDASIFQDEQSWEEVIGYDPIHDILFEKPPYIEMEDGETAQKLTIKADADALEFPSKAILQEIREGKLLSKYAREGQIPASVVKKEEEFVERIDILQCTLTDMYTIHCNYPYFSDILRLIHTKLNAPAGTSWSLYNQAQLPEQFACGRQFGMEMLSAWLDNAEYAFFPTQVLDKLMKDLRYNLEGRVVFGVGGTRLSVLRGIVTRVILPFQLPEEDILCMDERGNCLKAGVIQLTAEATPMLTWIVYQAEHPIDISAYFEKELKELVPKDPGAGVLYGAPFLSIEDAQDKLEQSIVQGVREQQSTTEKNLFFSRLDQICNALDIHTSFHP